MPMPSKPEDEKNIQISITMPPEVLEELDQRLKPGQSRSRAISIVIERWLKKTRTKWLKEVESGQEKPV